MRPAGLYHHPIDKLIARAYEAAPGRGIENVLAKLRELYVKDANRRERLSALFIDLATRPLYQRRRGWAARTCRDLGISLPKPLRRKRVLVRLFDALRRLVGLAA